MKEFLRQSWRAYKRLKKVWRKPRGIHSKLRRKLKSKGKMPNIGYRKPKEIRYLHPSGFKEVLISNIKELEKIDPKTEAIKIAHTVGEKKRQEIVKKAQQLNIKILNP